jgi:hypothetical protein
VTIDYTTTVGQVRLLAADADEALPLLSDAQYTALLTMEGSNLRLAAAQALDIMASSEALVSKKIRTQDLQTDGPAVAAELRARAESLRAQAADVDADGAVFAFDIADYDPTTWLLDAVVLDT